MNTTQVVRAVYGAADALQVPLDSDGILAECQFDKMVNIGPIRFSFPITAKSDILDEEKLALFVHFRGHLWAYVVVNNLPDNRQALWMVLFRSPNKTSGEWRHHDIKKTMDQIKNMIIAKLVFNGETWVEEPELQF